MQGIWIDQMKQPDDIIHVLVLDCHIHYLSPHSYNQTPTSDLDGNIVHGKLFSLAVAQYNRLPVNTVVVDALLLPHLCRHLCFLSRPFHVL
jgi:hypothetical protein